MSAARLWVNAWLARGPVSASVPPIRMGGPEGAAPESVHHTTSSMKQPTTTAIRRRVMSSRIQRGSRVVKAKGPSSAGGQPAELQRHGVDLPEVAADVVIAAPLAGDQPE